MLFRRLKLPDRKSATALGAALAVVMVVLSLYSRTINFGFLEHDDDRNIYENPRILHATEENLKSYWTEPYLGLYIPVTYMYWTAATLASAAMHSDSDIIRPQPAVFHAGNVALHTANALLVLALLRSLGLGIVASLIGALVFAAHPLQVEAVAWASGAKDLLSAFWGLLSLCCFSRCLSNGSPRKAQHSSEPSRWSTALYACSVVTFALAILAKPSQLVLPILYVLLIFTQYSRFERKTWRLLLPYIALIPLYFYFANATQGAEGTFTPVPLWARPLVAGDAVTFYATKVLIPSGLAVDYARHPTAALNSPWIWLTAPLPYVLLALLTYLAWRKRSPKLQVACVCMLSFVIMLLPALGFLPFGYQFFSTVCDRYAYMAMTAPALAAAAWAAISEKHRRINLTLASIILSILALITWRQVDYWQNELNLFSHSLEVQPEGAVALVGMSNEKAKSGDWQATIPLLENARRSLPDWARPHNNLGTTYVNLDQYDKAAAALAKALELRPIYPLALSNRCSVLRELNRLREAYIDCSKAIVQAPEFYPSYLNLALVAAKLGHWQEAESNFARALALNPSNYDSIYFWAMALREHGDLNGALAEFDKLLRLYPKSEEAARELATTREMVQRTARRASGSQVEATSSRP